MRKKTVLNFFDISSDVEELPKNELFKLKGGYSDVAWENEIEEIEILAPESEDESWEDGDDDDWHYDDWDEYDDEFWNDYGGGGGTGGNSNGGNNDSGGNESSDLPDELCFTALFTQYPEANPDGTPAHPSNDSYAENQCAIRVGAMFTDAYGVDFATSDNYTGNVTSEGYPRGAKDVADWLIREGLDHKEMTLSEFMNSEYYNQTGIIYQVAQGNSMAHVDIYTGGGNTGSGFYGNEKIVFFPIEDNGC